MAEYAITAVQKKQLHTVVANSYKGSHKDFRAISENNYFHVKHKANFDIWHFHIAREAGDLYNILMRSPILLTDKIIRNLRWDKVGAYFDNWIKSISDEIHLETGWEEDDKLFTGKSVDEGYQHGEKENYRHAVKQIQRGIPNLGLDAAAEKVLNAKLDIIYEKLDEMSKFDWLALLYGTVAQLILFYLIPSDQAGALWVLIKTSLLLKIAQ